MTGKGGVPTLEGSGDETRLDDLVDGHVGIGDELQQRLGAGDSATHRVSQR